MTDNEILKANDILDKFDFFNQRAGRELWSDKPKDIQDKDIENFSNDVKFLKDFLNRQQAEIERLKDENLQSEYPARIRVDDFFVCANSLGEWLEFCDSLKAEAIKEFVERLKKHIESLEYNVNTTRKTITVQMLYDQINWVLKEVIPKTIDGALKEMAGDAK